MGATLDADARSRSREDERRTGCSPAPFCLLSLATWRGKAYAGPGMGTPGHRHSVAQRLIAPNWPLFDMEGLADNPALVQIV